MKNKITYIDNIYIGGNVNNVGLIKIKLRLGMKCKYTYLIILSDSIYQLECVEAKIYSNKHLTPKKSIIVGIADSRSEAYNVILKITDDVYQDTKGADIRAYFEDKLGGC